MQMRSSASDASLPDAAEALLHVLRRRRVRRHYNPDRLAEWQIEALIEAGYWAPSGGNRRPVKFVVVDSQRQVRRVMAASPGIIGNPSALIILCIDWSKAPHLRIDDPRTTHPTHVDIGAAMQNILLAAEVLELGAGPVMSFHRATIRRLLHLPDEWTPLVIVTLGARADNRPETVEPATRERLDSVLIWDRSSSDGGRMLSKLDTGADVRAGLLEITIYLVAAARGNVDEPSGYGPLRLLEGAQRIVRLLDEAGLADDELRSFADQMTRKAVAITNDPVLARETADAVLEMLTPKVEDPDVESDASP